LPRAGWRAKSGHGLASIAPERSAPSGRQSGRRGMPESGFARSKASGIGGQLVKPGEAQIHG